MLAYCVPIFWHANIHNVIDPIPGETERKVWTRQMAGGNGQLLGMCLSAVGALAVAAAGGEEKNAQFLTSDKKLRAGDGAIPKPG